MSPSQEPALSTLAKHFVVGWKNNEREGYVGSSHGYTCDQAAVGTTNGAGPRNVQTFVLTSGGIVLHCLPGFWHPEDLAHELEMARTLHRLWKDKRSLKAKREMFARIQTRTIAHQPAAMVARSGWQGFDASNEKRRADEMRRGKKRDTFTYDAKGKVKRIKPTSTVVRERMAARPFRHFKNFDVETFVDYGRPYYDNNARIDGAGVRFDGSKGSLASQKRMADRRKKREAAKRAKRGDTPKPTEAKSKKKQKRQPKKRRAASRPTSRPTRRDS